MMSNCAKTPFLFIVFVIFVLSGCGGKNATSGPRLYTDSEKTTQTPVAPVDAEVERDSINYTAADTVLETPADAQPEASVAASLDTHRGNSIKDTPTLLDSIEMFFGVSDADDSASAVDDDIWRQFDLAEEYHSMGVIANREASWEEAQYYFEKSLNILANLDIETDSVQTPESEKYTRLIDDLVADYRVTLRSLGHMESDVSAAVLIERFADFGKVLDGDTMRVYASEQPQETTYDLPIVMNERVKNSIVYFQTVAHDAFSKYLRRSKKYTPMMRRILREHGLPEDLIYLSLVESGYNPHAYSWARAMGLWQFISSTGRLYGLKRNWWYDERKDPIKATHSAARFLKDLYKEFGDWELAMAAYNGGPGRVRRTIQSQRTTDFWKMKLKRQTMDYVPLIMAATIIAKDPEKYGFYGIECEPEVVWDEVEINKCLELSVVADAVGCSLEELKELNPELLRKHTPPNTKKYLLKIPVGASDKFYAAYEAMPSPKETSWVQHEIRNGETVSTIAARYGVSQYAILEANNLSNGSMIFAGKKIIVPVPLDREFAASQREPEEYTSKHGIYTVRSGDTMWDIAKAFGTTVSALRRVNYIERGSRIYVGQKVKIPSSATMAKNTEDESAPRVYAATKPQSAPHSIQTKYKVRTGDTLWDIARRFNTTTGKIRSLNKLGPSSRIYPGQSLVMSGGGESTTQFVMHKVERGDTMGQIASQYRTTIAKIMAMNGKSNPDDLQVGELLKIYSQ